MLRTKYLLFSFLLIFVVTASNAQRTYREYVRSGNKLYVDSIYDKAEIEYRKAIEKESENSDVHFNLGNALLYQNKAQEAIKEYELAAQREKDKKRLAQIYHNTGVIMQSAKDYAKAVEVYKEALRNNPDDNETRYNLALAMSQLKNQQQQQQNQEQQQDKEQQEEQQQQEQQQQNQEQNQQNQEQQQQQQQEQQQQEMSKENAQQLLESAMQDEKDVQEKVKKMIQLKGRKLEKDW